MIARLLWRTAVLTAFLAALSVLVLFWGAVGLWAADAAVWVMAWLRS